MTRARALVVAEPGRLELRDVEYPKPATGQVLIETAFSVTSPGTERRVVGGTQPDVKYPLIPGYSAAGAVHAVGPETSLSVGDRVVAGGIQSPGIQVAWGAHASLILAEAHAVQVIPDGVTFKHAAITKLAAIAQHGVSLSQVSAGDRVGVIGLGLIGQLVARLLLNHHGVDVKAGDLDPTRVEAARTVGLDAVQIRSDLSPLADDAFDFVFDATGVPSVATAAVRIIRALPWGTSPTRPPALVVQGSYPQDFCLPYTAIFRKEVRVLISRDEGPADRLTVLNRLADRSLPVDDLLERVVEPEALLDETTEHNHLTTVVQWLP